MLAVLALAVAVLAPPGLISGWVGETVALGWQAHSGAERAWQAGRELSRSPGNTDYGDPTADEHVPTGTLPPPAARAALDELREFRLARRAGNDGCSTDVSSSVSEPAKGRRGSLRVAAGSLWL